MKRIAEYIFDLLEVKLGVAIFILLFLSVVIQVFFRYVLNRPLAWPFELSLYSFVYVIFLGAGLASRQKSHISFDIIVCRFPQKVQLVISVALNIFMNGIILFLLPSSISYTIYVYRIKSAAMRIPWTYLFMVFPLSLALIVIHNTIWIVRYIRDLRNIGGK